MKYTTPSILMLISLLLGVSFDARSQELGADVDGVNWKKTIRVRGMMSKFDPFNETNLFKLQSDGGQISAKSDYVQFENIAQNFWVVLRDTLQNAIRDEKVNAYTLGVGQSLLRTARVKVTYENLLDSLTLAFNEFAPANDRQVAIFDPTDNTVKPFFLLRRILETQSRAGSRRLVNNFEYLSVYELELTLSVDETGFKIRPQSVIFGTAHWAQMGLYDPEKPLASFYTGYDINDPNSPKNIGFFVDLKEEKTIKFLIENGITYSGESSVIPFYDLITLFHYPYKIYSESNNVIAQAKLIFADKYADVDLEGILLNRYNDLTYSYLYGQAPQWWEQSKGAFTNGMYELDPATLQQQQAPQGN